MVKPLHAGQAAFHGLRPPTSPPGASPRTPAVLEGQHGFLDVFSDARSPGRARRAFADDAPLELVESGIALKRFACCGAIHSAQDALLELLGDGRGSHPSDVARIECRVNPLGPQASSCTT